MRPIIFLAVVLTVSTAEAFKGVPKAYNGQVFMHLMPWFETKESNPNPGVWGQHWTMVNMDPDIIDENGKRQIAAWYYPEIGPYDSGDEDVIEYQLNLMKYAGIDGVFIDWPGTLDVWDYVGNRENSEAIIRVAERVGMKYAIVYEDHNIGMAADNGFITDKLEAGRNDMSYLRDEYFTDPHYVHVNGTPLLLVFGPQTFQSPSEWSDIFSVFTTKPTFVTLWGESGEAVGASGLNVVGEYCWIYVDFLLGLTNFYKYREVDLKFGGAYPGFRTFYQEGGWPGHPGWGIDVGIETFTQTLDLAIEADLPFIQLNTWNDYGEGTMIEPTLEFGNQFLTILQEKLGVQYTERELNLVKDLYLKRKQLGKDPSKIEGLQNAANALNTNHPREAEEILKSL